MSNHLINNSLAMANSVSITEDSVLASPNINVGLLRPSATVLARKQTKVQPHHLANTIEGSGNAGATIMIQNTNTGAITHMTNKFYMQAMDITFKEKVQIMETFGKPVASFFGEAARVYNFSGVALEADTKRQNHKGEYFHGTSLLWLYEEFMRGTKLIDRASIAILNVANHSVYGYPIQFSYRALSDMPHAIQFSLSMFVKDHLWEIPQVVDRPTLEKNIYMNRNNHPNVVRLENLRAGPLFGLKDKIRIRASREWKELQLSDAENKGVATLQNISGALTSASGQIWDDFSDAVKGHFSDYKKDVTDYVDGVKNLYGGKTPTSTQAASFGFLKPSVSEGTNENADWTDNFVTTANVAFQWMPWSSLEGASNLLSAADMESLQGGITSGNFLSDINTSFTSLDGNEAFEKANAYGVSDAERGTYAATFQGLLQNIDTTIKNKLAYYYTTNDLADIPRDLVV